MTDPRNVLPNDTLHEELFHEALDGRLAYVWTAMPGIIESYDEDARTASVQPALMGKRTLRKGSTYKGKVLADDTVIDVAMPVIPDVPVRFQSGGGFQSWVPIVRGDECVLVFSCRQIDNWWQSGGVQPVRDLRMHDLSDAFCLPGSMSQAKLKGIAPFPGDAGLMSDDGLLSFSLTKATGKAVVKAPVSIDLNTPIVNVAGVINVLNTYGVSGAVGVFNGTLRATGQLQAVGDVLSFYGTANISVTYHFHGNVQNGSGVTSPSEMTP